MSKPESKPDKAEKPEIQERKPIMATIVSKPTGALVGVATFAIDTTDRGAQTVFGLVHDVRGEIRTAVDSGIDAAEKVVAGLFRVGKRATARVDELVAEVTTAGEKTVAGVVRGLRDTTRAAGELASTAAGAVIGGERSDGRAAAQA